MTTTAGRPGSRRTRRLWVLGSAALGVWLVWALRPERPGLPPLATLVKGAGVNTPRAFSPGGDTLYTAGDGAVEAWDVATATRRSAWPSPGTCLRVVVSPDGRRIATHTYRRGPGRSYLSVLDAATGEALSRFDVGPADVSRVAFGPAGATLLVYRSAAGPTGPGPGPTWECLTYDVGGGPPVAEKALPPAGLTGAAFSPDGRWAAGRKAAERFARLYDVESGVAVAKLDSGSGAAAAVTEFSPDGRLVAVGREDGTVEVWDVTSRALRTTLRGFSGGYWPHALTFTPDGNGLVAQAVGYGVGGWASLARHLARTAASFGRSQDLIEVVVFDVQKGVARARLRNQAGPTMDPDGAVLATVDVDKPGTARLWDLRGPGNLEWGSR